MFTDQIDKLKREYTDKYVVVDAARPELARFRDTVGRVKTVNMSGRALVEFMDYHVNIGWYDIDPAFLKVVDKPAPKLEKPKAEKKPAAPKAEAKPPTAAKPQAAPAAGKMSVAEMMAAARGGKGGAPAAAKPAAAKPKAEAAKPQAAKPAAGGKMSVAEMLAAARAGSGGAAAPETKPLAEAAPVEDAEAAPAPVAKAQAAAPADDRAAIHSRVDRTKMSVADMIAYCRKVDARG